MSNDKNLLDFSVFDPKESDSQALYQKFIAAVQQSESYRHQLRESQKTIKNPDDAIFQDMDELFNEVKMNGQNLWNQLIYGTSTKAPSSNVKRPPITSVKNSPTEAELIRLCRARDAAFFAYMDALKLDMPDETAVFAHESQKLTASDELTKPYLRSATQLKRNLEAIEKEIEAIAQIRRSWIDAIIETCFPAFVLKFLDYLTFEELNNEKKQLLQNEHNQTVGDLENLDRSFQEQWKTTYTNVKCPKDLKFANSLYLTKYLNTIDNDLLTQAQRTYSDQKDLSALVALYRLCCQLHYQAQQDDDHLKSSALDGALAQLKSLHPDMVDRLNLEHDTVRDEMQLLDKYQTAFASSKLEQKKINFFNVLYKKHQRFLTERSPEHFKALYQHIHTHKQYRKEPIVQETRKLLKELYPDAYQNARQYCINHIDESLCEQFVTKYERRNFDHPMYKQIMAFMHEPSFEALFTLKILMGEIKDTAYDLDPHFATFIADFMHICTQVTVQADAELSSEQSSTHDTASLSSRHSSCHASPSNRSRTSTNAGNHNKLTENKLKQHNQQHDPKLFGKQKASSGKRVNEANEQTRLLASN